MLRRIITFLAILASLIVVIAFSGPAQAAGVSNNPWSYDFNATGGKLITAPPIAFCGYFHCIPNFPRGIGYVVECHDGMYSKSGGRPGSCSRHRGDWRTLYAHSTITHTNPHPPVSSVGSSPSQNTPPDLPLTGSDPYVH